MSASARVKAALRTALRGLGYRVERITREELLYERGGYDEASSLPDGAAAELRADHPRLLELQRRYRAFDSPVCRHTRWDRELDEDALDLCYFRGDNAYVWQYRNVREHARMKYYLYARYIRELDRRGLFGGVLTEDGLFGCFAFRYHQMPVLSRDLLDSINELYFLDRHFDLFGRKGLRILDVGAGYGRLAHRILAATNVERYWCIDAIPHSTFLCEYYLRHRGCLGRAQVIPVDNMETAIPRGGIDLALNIHSFSEMGYDAIAAWIDWLARMDVRLLLIVPNEPEQLLSSEADGNRRDCDALLEQAGFRLAVREPTLPNPDLRELIGSFDHFFLYRRDAR